MMSGRSRRVVVLGTLAALLVVSVIGSLVGIIGR